MTDVMTVAARIKALVHSGPRHSDLEAEMAWQIASDLTIPLPEREYRFDPTRKWRADFAWPAQKLLVEVEGGIWTGGRHTRGSGFARDAEKYNAAAMHGWRILRFAGTQVADGTALIAIKGVLR